MGIVDWIFPKICVRCKREGEYICEGCKKMLVKPEGICPMCCKASLDGWTHPRCKTRLGMERLVVGLPYRGVVQQCLKKVKYKNSWDIITFLYDLCELPAIDGAIVTSVPMWRDKERVRGFNQADLLAELLAKSLPGVSRKVQKVDLLKRVRETKPMFGLKKKERQENIEGAFQIINNTISSIKQIQNSNHKTTKLVILVDDVWTTGATMRECTRMLKQAGAKEVWGLTLAR